MRFVHFGEKRTHVFCSDIRISVDRGIGNRVFVNEVVNEVGIAQLGFRKAVKPR